MNKIISILKDPKRILIAVLNRSAKLISDKLFLKLKFRLVMGEKLDLNNPKTFTQKLQWLKLYNRKPEYTTMVDKYAVKEYVANIIGKEHIIPTLGVWNSANEIDWDALPNQFVLKTTHGGGGGGVVICKDKATFDRVATKEKLSKSLKSDIYWIFREWPYKNVTKQIIAEQYLSELSSTDLIDYKFFCFNGNVLYCQVIKDRSTLETIDFFDTNWEHQDFIGLLNNDVIKKSKQPISQPVNFSEMVSFAQKLSKGIPFVRVDFYNLAGKIYFGELTFFPASGLGKFEPKEWDVTLGNYLSLPAEKSL